MYVDQMGQTETVLINIWEKTKTLNEETQDDTPWGFRDIWEKLSGCLDGIGSSNYLYSSNNSIVHKMPSILSANTTVKGSVLISQHN